jgi:hypothetical protein
MNKKSTIQGHFRLLSGQDDDLITWWKSLNDLPYGGKGQAIKEALRNGLDLSGPGSTPCRRQPCGQAGLRPGAGELEEVHPCPPAPTHPNTQAQSDLLLDIRRVVEAAVIETLNQANVTVQESSKEHDLGVDNRVEALLTSLDRSLLLPEDNEDDL